MAYFEGFWTVVLNLYFFFTVKRKYAHEIHSGWRWICRWNAKKQIDIFLSNFTDLFVGKVAWICTLSSFRGRSFSLQDLPPSTPFKSHILTSSSSAAHATLSPPYFSSRSRSVTPPRDVLLQLRVVPTIPHTTTFTPWPWPWPGDLCIISEDVPSHAKWTY